MGSIDTVSPASRKFYEFTKGKLVVSMLYGLLAFAALLSVGIWGGETDAGSSSLVANYDWNYRRNPRSSAAGDGDDKVDLAEANYGYGFGFATFFVFLSFLLFTVMGIYSSPLIFGSDNEKLVLKSGPLDIDGGASTSV